MSRQYVFGFVGPRCGGAMRRAWNAFLVEKKVDGFFDGYRASSARDLELRFSEMFLLDRRGYCIAPSLQTEAFSFMDTHHDSAKEVMSVDTVLNDNGVLIGYFLGDVSMEERFSLWMGNETQ